MGKLTTLDFAYHVADFNAFLLEVATLVRDGWTREELFQILIEKADLYSGISFNITLQEEKEALEQELQDALKKVITKAESGDPNAKKLIDDIWELS